MGLFSRKKQPAAPAPEQGGVQGKRPRMAPLGRMVARMFDAGESDRLTASWGSQPLTADQVVQRNHRTLVARSREQVSNNDYARAFIRMCVQNIVGPAGVTLQAQAKDASGKLDELANQALELMWRDWGKPQHCDITGRQSFRALCESAVRAAARDGEFFFRKIGGRQAGKWRFALQQIDALRCPADYDKQLNAGRFVRAGIEYTEFGKPVAYYFTTTDPSQAEYSYHSRPLERIPADQIIHGYVADMVGQKRGLPWMATGLWRMKMLDGFEKSALVNARVSAAKGGFFEWEEGYGPEQNEDEELYMDAEPGSFQELPAGVRFKEWNPQYPSGEFMPFHKTMLRGIASGMGVAYNNLASDLEGVNFSSIRQGTLEEREHWKGMQQWLIEQLIQPVWDELLPVALLVGVPLTAGGNLKPERLTKYQQVNWQPRRWSWVDPRADVDAAIKSKNSLLQSPSQIMQEQGKDPTDTWRQWARDIEAMRAAGIPDDFISQAIGLAPQPEQESDNE
jgi:lambda family phage portal protein